MSEVARFLTELTFFKYACYDWRRDFIAASMVFFFRLVCEGKEAMTVLIQYVTQVNLYIEVENWKTLLTSARSYPRLFLWKWLHFNDQLAGTYLRSCCANVRKKSPRSPIETTCSFTLLQKKSTISLSFSSPPPLPSTVCSVLRILFINRYSAYLF